VLRATSFTANLIRACLGSNGVFRGEFPACEPCEAWHGPQGARRLIEWAVGAVRVEAAKFKPSRMSLSCVSESASDV
jgi:hypothetical protein